MGLDPALQRHLWAARALLKQRFRPGTAFRKASPVPFRSAAPCKRSDPDQLAGSPSRTPKVKLRILEAQPVNRIGQLSGPADPNGDSEIQSRNHHECRTEESEARVWVGKLESYESGRRSGKKQGARDQQPSTHSPLLLVRRQVLANWPSRRPVFEPLERCIGMWRGGQRCAARHGRGLDAWTLPGPPKDLTEQGTPNGRSAGSPDWARGRRWSGRAAVAYVQAATAAKGPPAQVFQACSHRPVRALHCRSSPGRKGLQRVEPGRPSTHDLARNGPAIGQVADPGTRSVPVGADTLQLCGIAPVALSWSWESVRIGRVATEEI